jgi:polyhydroxyalkanoate synthesis regulator phasin
MDEPGNGEEPGGSPDVLERIVTLLGLRLDETRSLVDDVTSRWRGDALRIGEGSKRRVQDLARELGLVTRDEWDELELRVAQLEHRLRLVEDADRPSPLLP